MFVNIPKKKFKELNGDSAGVNLAFAKIQATATEKSYSIWFKPNVLWYVLIVLGFPYFVLQGGISGYREIIYRERHGNAYTVSSDSNQKLHAYIRDQMPFFTDAF